MDCLGSNISYLSVARVTEEKEQEEVAGARRSGATAGPAGCKEESHGRELTPSPARMLKGETARRDRQSQREQGDGKKGHSKPLV